MVNLKHWVAQGLNSNALQPNRKLQFKGTPTNKAQEELKWCSVICDAKGTVKVSGWSFLLDENHAQRDSRRAPCDLRGADPWNQMFWQKLRASCTYFIVLLGILLQWPYRKRTFHLNYIILEKTKTKRQKKLLKLRTRLFQETNKRRRCYTVQTPRNYLINFCSGVSETSGVLAISAHTSSATGERHSCSKVWSK